MEKIENKFKNHLSALGTGIFFSSILFSLVIWFEFDTPMIIICLLYFSIFILPSFYLYFEYKYFSSDRSYILSNDNIIYVNSNKEEYSINIGDIKNITIYGSATLFTTWFHFTAMEQYHFAEIRLNDNSSFIITCLLSPRVDKLLSRYYKIKIKKGLFNSVLVNKKGKIIG